MKFLIFGDGYIGNAYNQYFNDSFLSTVRINSVEDVLKEINIYSPSVVINCVGKTGRPNIDWCETNQFVTLQSNVMVPVYIQEACKETNTKMVHIGTGCMYSGSNNFKEEDQPNYLKSYYSKTKYLAEISLDQEVLQLRIRMPIDGSHCYRNFLKKLLGYEETINVQNSITSLEDLMRVSDILISSNEYGVFNIIHPEPISHSEIINIYNKYANEPKKIKEISLNKLAELTKTGRSNCTLSSEKLNSRGIFMRHTIQAVEQCVKEYVNAESKAVL